MNPKITQNKTKETNENQAKKQMNEHKHHAKQKQRNNSESTRPFMFASERV